MDSIEKTTQKTTIKITLDLLFQFKDTQCKLCQTFFCKLKNKKNIAAENFSNAPFVGYCPRLTKIIHFW